MLSAKHHILFWAVSTAAAATYHVLVHVFACPEALFRALLIPLGAFTFNVLVQGRNQQAWSAAHFAAAGSLLVSLGATTRSFYILNADTDLGQIYGLHFSYSSIYPNDPLWTDISASPVARFERLMMVALVAEPFADMTETTFYLIHRQWLPSWIPKSEELCGDLPASDREMDVHDIGDMFVMGTLFLVLNCGGWFVGAWWVGPAILGLSSASCYWAYTRTTWEVKDKGDNYNKPTWNRQKA
ncbi:hypothetical protein B0T22DRAFT_484984 [Podospora appendiculata]|uniref:Uncharacterized protein n=1 Tax=Podospora appendiculata TaxID=314037 RepID=A0AAE0X1Y5_9PEZI|nr:hypothetical protein B0T22DRAFT_484984 [Podospora appendiculata]